MLIATDDIELQSLDCPAALFLGLSLLLRQWSFGFLALSAAVKLRHGDAGAFMHFVLYKMGMRSELVTIVASLLNEMCEPVWPAMRSKEDSSSFCRLAWRQMIFCAGWKRTECWECRSVIRTSDMHSRSPPSPVCSGPFSLLSFPSFFQPRELAASCDRLEVTFLFLC